MRQRLPDILTYLLAIAIGFYTAGVVFYLCAYLRLLPSFPVANGATGGDHAAVFMGKFQLAALVWMLGIVAGLLGFVPRLRAWRFWLLLLPVSLPLVYTALLFIYFNFLPKS